MLPGGTAYITDVGMTGPRGGVIGVRKEQAIESLRTHMSMRFETSEDDPWLMGVLIRCSPQPLRAEAIEQLLRRRRGRRGGRLTGLDAAREERDEHGGRNQTM